MPANYATPCKLGAAGAPISQSFGNTIVSTVYKLTYERNRSTCYGIFHPRSGECYTDMWLTLETGAQLFVTRIQAGQTAGGFGYVTHGA